MRPDTVVRQSILVTAGTIATDGTPVAGAVFLEPSYDMVERVVTFRLPAGSTWVPGVLTTVRLLQATDDPSSAGLRTLESAGLAQPIDLTFTATSDAMTAEPAAPYSGYCDQCDPTTGALTAVGAKTVLANSCNGAACHSDGGAYVAQGLTLLTPAGLAGTAFRYPAHEALTAPSSVDAPDDPFVFGRNMPVIDPGNPGNSYLMYKVLLDPDSYTPESATTKNPTPQKYTVEAVGGSVTPDAGLYDDMREAFVIGDPMPLTGSPVHYDRSRLLQDWIAAGAPTADQCTVCGGATFAGVHTILAANCAVSGCHTPTTTPSGTFTEHDLDLGGDASLFVNKGRRDHPDMPIVKPSDPDASFMVTMIKGTWQPPACDPSTDDACGDRMPQGGKMGQPPGTYLSDAEIQTIVDWIKAGAPAKLRREGAAARAVGTRFFFSCSW